MMFLYLYLCALRILIAASSAKGPATDISCANCKLQKCDEKGLNCTEGCGDGYYGPLCTYPCSKECLHNKCETAAAAGVAGGPGKCTEGCNDGWWGVACKIMCPLNCKKCYTSTRCLMCEEFHFGQICNQSCRDQCPCSGCSMTGTCKRACPSSTPGVQGHTTGSTSSNDTFWSKQTFIVVCAGVGLVTVVLITLLLLRFCKPKMLKSRKRSTVIRLNQSLDTPTSQNQMNEEYIEMNQYHTLELNAQTQRKYVSDRRNVTTEEKNSASVQLDDSSCVACSLVTDDENFGLSPIHFLSVTDTELPLSDESTYICPTAENVHYMTVG